MPSKLKNHSLIFIMLTASMALLNCRAADKNNMGDTTAFKSVVKSKLGESYETGYNKPKTYALCKQVHTADHALRKLNFIVVRLSDNKVIKEGSFRAGDVKWLDDDSIEISSTNSPATRGDEIAAEKKIIDIPVDQH